MNTIFESTEEIYGRLPEAWQLMTLGELIKKKRADLQTGPFGTMLHASSYKSIGTPVLAVQHIGENRIIHKWDIPRVDSETYQRLSRYKIKVNDIIFSRKGAVERTALVTQKEKGWLQGSDCIRLRLLDPSIYPVYISYVFCSVAYRKWIVQHAHGATMPSLNQQIINLSPLPIPPLDEQKRIADVLSCLDAKIDNLRLQNETLEEIARSIFKHWFIDFEFPNADGKPHKSSGGAMVRSELGDIPEGWQVGKLENVTKISTGKSLKRHEFEHEGIYPVLGANGEMGRTDKFLTESESILTGRVGTLGTVNINYQKAWISDNVIIFDPVLNFFYYVYFVLKNTNIKNLNRGSTQPLITQGDLKMVDILMPDIELTKKLEITCQKVFNKKRLNEQQIQTLTKTRDTLLPKLMSGQLRVKE